MRRSAIDLISSVRALIGNIPNSVLTNAQILTVANDVLDYMTAYRRPSELAREVRITTTRGVDVYALDQNIARVLDMTVDGVRIREVSIADLPYLDLDQGEPRFWMMWRPQDVPPYNQQIRIIPVPDDSYQLVAAAIGRHPQLIESPVPTPILLSHGNYLSLCEMVAEKILLGFGPQEATGFAGASRSDAESDNAYRYSSRGVSLRVNRVGGAIVPRSRRRSLW